MLKKATVLLSDTDNRFFRVGDVVKIRILDMFGNNDTTGRIMEINDDKVILDTSAEYCSDQKTIYFNKVYSIDKVE